MNIKILVLLSAVFLIGCGGGSGSSDSDNSDSVCTNDYVVGVWFYQRDEVGVTMEYREDNVYTNVQSLAMAFPEGVMPPPPLTTTGTYSMGDKVTTSDDMEACQVIRTIGNTSCEYLVHVDGDMLYESSCGSEEIDFNTEYIRH